MHGFIRCCIRARPIIDWVNFTLSHLHAKAMQQTVSPTGKRQTKIKCRCVAWLQLHWCSSNVRFNATQFQCDGRTMWAEILTVYPTKYNNQLHTNYFELEVGLNCCVLCLHALDELLNNQTTGS